MKKTTLLALAALSASAVTAAGTAARQLQLTADRVTADRATESLMASGHVVAVCHPIRITSEMCEKDADNCSHFHYPTTVTTCTNQNCRLHWQLCAEAEYAEGKHIWMRDMTLRLWDVPVFWLPYWYYPLDGECGWRVMVGYTGRWGAYMLNKYVYHIAGDREYAEGSWYLYGNTRLDLRYENGIAAGESLHWQLGDFGRGRFKVYYAWDQDTDRYAEHWDDTTTWNYRNWGSEPPDNRYGVELEHEWEISERDRLRLYGAIYSDSHFRGDFIRDSIFNIRNQFGGYNGNELSWEHVEKRFGFGASVSGPLNEFVAGTSRLPEFFFDVAPTPVPYLPLNYESSTRLGYLHRRAAEYGDSDVVTAYSYNPGEWANYNTFRFDTYHRLTAPFKVADVLSVVPRVGWHGTYWNDSGYDNLTGWGVAGKSGESVFRSILEGGVTFAARGSKWLTERKQHVIEPYLDVLAQEAWYSGVARGNRPYVFDSIDASTDWSDQFAGRSRNLPYSYYGVTPGLRNALRTVDANGRRRTLLDLDVYAALQFNPADYTDGNDWHRLADPGSPNYGKHEVTVVPGARVRWFPDADSVLRGYFEYDSDNNKIAQCDLRWSQRLAPEFNYHVSVMQRNYRWWDFSSTPFDATTMRNEDFNRVHFWFAEIGFEHEICDAIAWSPYLRWDCREGELDSVGAWIDFRTDCLGFRFIVEYDNSYYRIDGSEYENEWSFGFYVYLRAFGSDAGSLFGD